MPEVDDRFFPLVVNVLPPRLELADLGPFLAKQEALLARRLRYMTITDASAVQHVPPATVRKALADWSKRMDDMMRRYAIGTSIVIASPITRGALTALFWLAPPPYPTEVVASRLEGLDKLVELSKRLGEPVPKELLAYRQDFLANLARAPL